MFEQDERKGFAYALGAAIGFVSWLGLVFSVLYLAASRLGMGFGVGYGQYIIIVIIAATAFKAFKGIKA